MSGVILSLNACLEGRASSEYTEVVFACVRTAVSDPEWRAKLVSTVSDMHSSADGVGHLAFRTIPETAVIMALRRFPEKMMSTFGRVHLCFEPQGPSKDTGNQQKVTHKPHMRLAYLLYSLMSIAPVETLSACEAPATEFDQLSPEKQALEPSMEYTVMEIIHAALVSGAAFTTGPSGQSAWDAWLWTVLQGRYESATVDRAGVVVHTIAHALRLVANQVTGVQGMAPHLTQQEVDHMLDVTTTAICQLVDRWSGSSASDRKHSLLLSYSLDMLMQVLLSSSSTRWLQFVRFSMLFIDCGATVRCNECNCLTPLLLSVCRRFLLKSGCQKLLCCSYKVTHHQKQSVTLLEHCLSEAGSYLWPVWSILYSL